MTLFFVILDNAFYIVLWEQLVEDSPTIWIFVLVLNTDEKVVWKAYYNLF